MEIALVIKAKNAVIQRFLDARGWKQADLARAVEAHPTHVADWCNMKNFPRSNEVMFKLCELLNLAPEQIFPDLLMDREWLKKTQKRTYQTTVYKDVEVLSLADCKQVALPPAPNDRVNQQLFKVLDTLTPREETIIKMRFGLEGEEHTLEEVAEHFGLTRTRISQLEHKALRKLKHPYRKKILKEAMEG